MQYFIKIQEIVKLNIFKIGFGVVVGGLLIGGITLGIYEAIFVNKNYPGLAVAGIDVSGLSFDETINKLVYKFGNVKELSLVHGTNRWVVPIENFELVYDYTATAEQLIRTGRNGNLRENLNLKLKSLSSPINIEPIFTINENRLSETISSISAELDIPAQEPEIVVTKIGEQVQIEVLAGENGQSTNVRLLMQMVKNSLKTGSNSVIEIPVIKLEPKLTEIQMDEAKKRSEKLVGKILTVYFPEANQKWDIGDEQLIAWINPISNNWKIDQIEGWVNKLAEGVDRAPQNASLRFENGRVTEFEPAHDGFRVKKEEMVGLIKSELENIMTGQRLPQLVLITETFPPEVETADVNSLGIKELIGKGESWFSGSITNRIYNLKKSAEAINGVLVAPGETFSFNHYVGEISAATGYKPAYIIKEGKTILGDGGGVCQTSSTLFRAVLAAGLPIEERVAHAYRVHYYEENYQVGFDATIFQPSPDFKFKNDTPGHILIQMKFEEAKKHLAFEIYGTSDGRKIEISKSRTWEVTPPPPDLYVDDPTLAAGVVRQVEHAAWGAKVAFDWKVTRGEEVLQERTFYSNYRPWQAVYTRGTKI